MKNKGLAFVIFLSSVCFLSCKDNDEFFLDRVDVELITMSNGVEKSTFEEGADVTLALKIINNSGKDFEWLYEYECQLSTQYNFMLVRKKVKSEDSNITSILVGTPSQFPFNCLSINLPPQFIVSPGDKKIAIAYPWISNPDNTKLRSGEYFSEFAIMIDVDGHQKTWNLRTDFTIR